MKLLHWTVFIDLLGYQELNGEVIDIKSAETLIEFMNSNKEVIQQQTDDPHTKAHYAKEGSWNLYEHYKIDFAFISDSLIISYTPNLEKDFEEHVALGHSANALLIITLRLNALINKCILEKKIFLRGGISNGYSYISESFAVGTGVGLAYSAESKQAKYPRVILANDVTQNLKLMTMINWLSDTGYKTQVVKKDHNDGMYYLDFNNFMRATLDNRSQNQNVIQNAIQNFEKYVQGINFQGRMLGVHKHAIEFQIKKALTLKACPEKQKLFNSLKEKYLWLTSYHNNSCEEFSKLELPFTEKNMSSIPKELKEFKEIFKKIISSITILKIDEKLRKSLED